MLRFVAALRRLHGRLVPWLEVPADRLGPWTFGIALAVIVIIGAIVRARMMISGLSPDSMMNGQPMLSSTDGFYFAAGVGNMLTDAWGNPPRLPYPEGHALVAITGMLVKVLGIERDAAFAWMPVIVGPLVAVPLAFLGRALGRSMVGLVAGLFAMLAPAYVVRSALGYFDTDMFSVTVPLIAILFLVRLFRVDPDAPAERVPRIARRDALVAALALSSYIWFYDQGAAIAQTTALLAALGLVALVILRRANPAGLAAQAPPALSETPRHAFLLGLTGLPVYWLWRGLGLVVVHLALMRIKVPAKVLTVLAVVVMIGSIAASPAGRQLLVKLNVYSDATAPEMTAPGQGPKLTDQADSSWRYTDTTGVVAEARVLPLGRMAEKLAGHWLIALAGLIGFLAFLLWRPSLFVILPLTAVGVFAFIGGHRFLMYLTPAIGLGVGWLGARLTRPIAARARLAATAVIGGLAAVPAVLAVPDNELSVAFHRSEAESLLALDAISSPHDTTITWWDFGYPIQYFAKTRTVTDGSRRSDDAALAAEILLTSSPLRAARLARVVADAGAIDPSQGSAWVLLRGAKQRGLGPDAFLAEVESGRWPPFKQRSGDVYLFLSKRLVSIIPVLEATRPTGGNVKRGAAYQMVFQGIRSEGSTLYLQGGIEVDADKVLMRRPRPDGQGLQQKSLREVIVVGGSGSTFQKQVRKGDPNAKTSGILLRDLRIFIELDPHLLETQFAQLYFFENADPAFYEKVYLTATTKIYRVKQ